MIFSVTPSASSSSSVGGWIVAARWSFTGAGSCSHTVTAIPRGLSASAHTMPTGPAPATRTRAFRLPPAIRRLLHAQPEVAHDGAPPCRVGGAHVGGTCWGDVYL